MFRIVLPLQLTAGTQRRKFELPLSGTKDKDDANKENLVGQSQTVASFSSRVS